MKLLKDYDITIQYYKDKANIVADALNTKAVTMGSLALLVAKEQPLTMIVHSLSNSFVRLDICNLSRVFSCVETWSLFL